MLHSIHISGTGTEEQNCAFFGGRGHGGGSGIGTCACLLTKGQTSPWRIVSIISDLHAANTNEDWLV